MAEKNTPPTAGEASTPHHQKPPRSSAERAVLAFLRPSRSGDGLLGIVAIPVLAPLPDIAVHVIQAPLVGLLLTDRVGLSAAVLGVPSVLFQFGLGVAKE